MSPTPRLYLQGVRTMIHDGADMLCRASVEILPEGSRFLIYARRRLKHFTNH